MFRYEGDFLAEVAIEVRSAEQAGAGGIRAGPECRASRDGKENIGHDTSHRSGTSRLLRGP
jgi:hypothetical protein